MFKKIQVKDFQSHKSSVLDLHPNVNVIVGRSSSGKTAIFRAIQWLVYNRPLGTRFIRHGQEQSEVIIDEVKGVKTSHGKTNYRLTGMGNNTVGDTDWVSGSSVPDVITKTLNINPINISNQLDTHFLITDSPGEVARVFNKIVNIEKADEYVSALTTKINSENNKINDLKEKVTDYKQRIADLDYLEDLEITVSNIEKKTIVADDLRLLRDDLEHKIVLLKDLVEKDKILIEQISFLNGAILSLTKKYNRILELEDFAIKLEDFIILQEKQNELIKKKNVIDKYIPDLECKLDYYDRTLAVYTDLDNTCTKWNEYNFDRKEIEKRQDLNKKILAEAFVLYKEELIRIKICPFCLSEITGDVIEHLMEKIR